MDTSRRQHTQALLAVALGACSGEAAREPESPEPAPSNGTFRARADSFRDAYIDDSIRALDQNEPSVIFSGTTFLGVPVWQNPCDLWRWQQLLADYRPQRIVEAGTARGGLALWLANVLEQVQPDAHIHTIDLDPELEANLQAAREHALFQRFVSVHHGSSTDRNIVARVARDLNHPRVIVTLDSDHSSEHVANELRAYAPLIPPGGYLVVQDTVIDERPDYIERFARWHNHDARGGPGLAVTEFLATDIGRAFEVVRDLEAFGLTFYPDGWLRRRA
ncbi:MAG: CmcI family methyltransferase [Myxococcota bacterium]